MTKFAIFLISLLLVHNALPKEINKNGDAGPNSNVLPVVMWHGMGDTCCFPFSLGSLKKLIENETNGTYVKSLEIGGNIIEDYRSGFFIHPSEQIEDACEQISSDPKLARGYNALGFSQGGQFLRAVAQKCPNPPMVNLVTFGGQHQGIFGLPKCLSVSSTMCEYFRRILTTAAYEGWVQRDLVQATYWHDPLHEDEYKTKSTFLSDINNAYTTNTSYIKNLNQLKRFIMVKFLNDTIVQPKESQWFGFYAPGQDMAVLPLQETEFYSNDYLGLKIMDEVGKLVFLATEGDHLQFSTAWFTENIIPYLLEN